MNDRMQPVAYNLMAGAGWSAHQRLAIDQFGVRFAHWPRSLKAIFRCHKNYARLRRAVPAFDWTSAEKRRRTAALQNLAEFEAGLECRGSVLECAWSSSAFV